MIKPLLFILLFLINTSITYAAPRIQSWTLNNGARVLFVEDHTLPILDLNIEFDAGSQRDPVGKFGLAELTNDTLTAGTKASDARAALNQAQISDAFADIAAQYNSHADRERAGIKLRILSNPSQQNLAINLLELVLAHPSFPTEIVLREQERKIAEIKEQETKPEFIARKLFWSTLYPNHPYGRTEDAASLAAITVNDIHAFYQTHYLANHAIISIVGDIDKTRANTIAEQLTAKLPQGTPLATIPTIAPPTSQELRIAHPASQAHILIGVPALERKDPDYFALLVGNYILGGGGFTSRLTREVREKRGLSYSVNSNFRPMLQQGPFQIGLQTKKEQANQALDVVRDTLKEFLTKGPTTKELQAAKDNLINGFALRIDSNRKILDNVAMIGYYQLPDNYLDTWTAQVQKISLSDITRAFDRKIKATNLVTVIVGDK